MTMDIAAPGTKAGTTPEDGDASVSLVELLTWLGEGKRFIGASTVAVAILAFIVALLLPPIYTARTTLLPPNSQQQGNAAAALATLGSLGGLAGGLTAKSPDELYVALLRSDSVIRALDVRFNLKERYDVKSFEALRRMMPGFIRIAADKKTGVIRIEVDDEDAKFAAAMANAHLEEVMKLLGRLAVSEAQQRRAFFATQLKETKDGLVAAETELRRVQEQTGVMVLDKQAEAMIAGIAQLRALIAEREVSLKVLRTSATAANPDVVRLTSEVSALRAELARVESSEASSTGRAAEIPVAKLPTVATAYVRARRELKLQETLLEAMVRQFELAKLDEAREGPLLQQVDAAVPPDYRSKPSRLILVLSSTVIALFASAAWVTVRRYAAQTSMTDPARASAWRAMRQVWWARG
jgi:tyrosine-protein kinase Etk/Wzc